MIRYIQRLEGYIAILLVPSTDNLTVEDHRVFVSGQKGLGSSIDTHGPHSFQKLSSKPVAPQGNRVSQSLLSNSRSAEPSSGVSLQDARYSSTGENTGIAFTDEQNVNSRGTVHIDPEFHSDQSTTRVTMFEKAHNFNIENAPITNIGLNINYQHLNTHGNHSLDSLKEFVSFSAFHDSSAQDPERCCHPGTREKVLDEMRTWTGDPNAAERILWLHGPAGVGKSAIAQTAAYSYARDKVGATFFFFRSDPDRNDGNRLFATLAWRLASSVPIVKDLIAFSLEDDPDLPRKAIEAQFDHLIARPFLNISGSESAKPTFMRVIIIDGLDECSDVKLQRRILKIVGNAVADTRFPLRFIISSRPEAHIEDFFAQFPYPTLQIDLANVDEAYHDIEIYLTSEFTRIAVEQELDPRLWPGQDTIDTLVSNSSGQFVYASTVIKYTGDEYESAVARLNVILGLKPCTGKSPFAELDALYIEILQRQPDQEFLKKFLPILVAHSMLVGIENKILDDAMLLDLDKPELHRKLRGMHSLLKIKPIDVHHKSFLDFLDDSSRSGEYHVSKHFASRRYMQLITDALIKAASRAIKQPNSHEGDHFKPRFATVIKRFPFPIQLPLDVLEEILLPLQIIQENLLQLPSMSVPWKPRACDKCWTFYMIDDLLLHLAWFRAVIRPQKHMHAEVRPLTAMEEKQSIPQLDLEACLSLLLANLRGVELLLNTDTICLVRALVRFDPTETAMKLRSITDAQNLIELIFCLSKNGCFKSWFGAEAYNATRLALEICGRVPILPQSLFLNITDFDSDKYTYQGKGVEVSYNSHTIHEQFFDEFVSGSLSHGNIGTRWGICSDMTDTWLIYSKQEDIKLFHWRQCTNPSISKILQIFFEIAKTIQYVHSLGIVFRDDFSAHDIYVDPENHIKMECYCFHINHPNGMWRTYDGYNQTESKIEENIYDFGSLLYAVLVEFDFDDRVDAPFEIRPSKPEIPDNVWQLIQCCCARDPEKRPTMDQVVQEIESLISHGQSTLSS